jgi:hypothetical protein
MIEIFKPGFNFETGLSLLPEVGTFGSDLVINGSFFFLDS